MLKEVTKTLGDNVEEEVKAGDETVTITEMKRTRTKKEERKGLLLRHQLLQPDNTSDGQVTVKKGENWFFSDSP